MKPVKGFIRRDSYVEKFNDTQEFLRKRGETEQEWKKRIAKLREEMRIKAEKEKQEKLERDRLDRERLIKLKEEQLQLLNERSHRSSHSHASIFQNNGANASNLEEEGFFSSSDLKKGMEIEYSKSNLQLQFTQNDYSPNNKDRKENIIVVDRQDTDSIIVVSFNIFYILLIFINI